MRLDDALPPNAALTPVSGGLSAPANEVDSSAPSTGFKLAWQDVQSVRTVQAGDNLVSIVRQHAQSQGVTLTESQTLRMAQSLATHNGMANANRIYPGQNRPTPSPRGQTCPCIFSSGAQPREQRDDTQKPAPGQQPYRHECFAQSRPPSGREHFGHAPPSAGQNLGSRREQRLYPRQ